jgi:prepilin-type N-terminal cleavage/methylation domain-containing protein
MKLAPKSHLHRMLAFTLVEMLLVIAVISILASMVISSFSDAAQTSREVVVRQQLAVCQSALNNWVDGKLGRYDDSIRRNPTVPEPGTITLERLTGYYNTLTSVQRFRLISGTLVDDPSDTSIPKRKMREGGYLDDMTASHFEKMATQFGPADFSLLKTDAMVQTARWLTLPNWVSGSYPTVNLNPGAAAAVVVTSN